MRIALVSNKSELIKKDLKELDIQTVKKNPDYVLAFGGDGTLLASEEKYPGVPKIFIYYSGTCLKCSVGDFKHALKFALENPEKFSEFILLEAEIGKKKIVALNDINIHYTPPCALRYS
ncbi:MAG TPA: hypothetical protein ENN30_02520, partial [Candidatus Woesearchaeota archaeon]|nr:hypothetical protein [Candidatus Woesearchaeota archaeon]